ncbi:hypothetical protein [Halodesulfovibrio marinisediminis]|uniref:Uncharacterized protein n=1 Tax=Halodesulfovibrio marinisediminis DSM 17456 TaxID=1121457 RepID=A0A1N6HF26_9BACT|nr:hypothetical protein [Halodesulfovibrio marinisediminis]SIO18317.1 hypothetical protein SAMN02745161_2170 [Halodesulfovibrio marinisediminis DSM 17456]
MSTFRIASLIHRFLLQKSESEDGQTTSAASGEDSQQINLASEEGHEDDEQSSLLFIGNNSDDSLSVAGDYSFLLPQSEHLLGAFPSEEDPPTFFTLEATWDSPECIMDDSSFALNVAAQSGPFVFFAEQVVSSLSRHSSFLSVSDGEIDSESPTLSLVPQNHYHPDSDSSPFSLSDLFSQPTDNFFVEVSSESDFESVQHPEVVLRMDIVEEVLSGEVLTTDNDASIYFYDGEPIEIGVPVVLEPTGDRFTGHTSGGGDRPVHIFPPKGQAIALADEYGKNVVLRLDAGRGDEDLVLDLAKFHPEDIILVTKFELGRDTLSIKSLLGAETVETLWDNAPTDCVGKEGEAILGFSVDRDKGEECTVAFVGLTHEDYMEFLSAAMHKVT